MMEYDIHKAGLWKRVSAGLFDVILTAILAAGIVFLLSSVLGYDGYSKTVNEAYDKYEAQFGINFDITQEEFEALSAQERQLYEDAAEAMNADTEAVYAYNMMTRLILLMITAGLLLSHIVLEFLVPLWLKNGQTLGKKIFGICLIRTDGVKVNNLQMFTRTVLGKFTIETMVPVYIVLMLFFDGIGLLGTVILGAIGIGQLVSYAVTRTNSLIHDLLAGTAVVDFSSQRIFASTEALVEYQKRIAAERAARQEY